MIGYVKIYRSVFETDAFKKEPFSRREAWIWLVANASWKPHQYRHKSSMVPIGRGQLPGARKALARVWGWGEQRVRTYLDFLVSQSMITLDSNQQLTIITVCNYDKYQADQLDSNQQLTSNQPATNHTEEEKELKEKKEASSTQAREDEFEKFIDRELIEWVAACLNPFAPEATYNAEQILRGHAKLYPPSQIAKGLTELRTAMSGNFKPRDFGKAMNGYIVKARPVVLEQSQTSTLKLDVYDRMVPTNVEPVDDVWAAEMREARHAH